MTWDYAEVAVRVGSAALAMTWDQWVVLLLGVPAIGMTQIESLRRFACFPGLAGQIGWFGGLQPQQPAFYVASVLCCLIWLYSLWKFWGAPLLDSIETGLGPQDTAGPSIATTTRRRRPSLRLVSKTKEQPLI